MIILSCAAAATNAGCVIPLGPEFQDPQENLAPWVVSVSPPEGETISPLPGTSISISATIGDPNLADTLYARWIFDYPPRTPNSRQAADQIIPPPGNDSPLRVLTPLSPNCILHNIAGGQTSHRLLLVVSDRPFKPYESAPADYPYDAITDGAQVTRVVWPVVLDCNQ